MQYKNKLCFKVLINILTCPVPGLIPKPSSMRQFYSVPHCQIYILNIIWTMGIVPTFFYKKLMPTQCSHLSNRSSSQVLFIFHWDLWLQLILFICHLFFYAVLFFSPHRLCPITPIGTSYYFPTDHSCCLLR